MKCIHSAHTDIAENLKESKQKRSKLKRFFARIRIYFFKKIKKDEYLYLKHVNETDDKFRRNLPAEKFKLVDLRPEKLELKKITNSLCEVQVEKNLGKLK